MYPRPGAALVPHPLRALLADVPLTYGRARKAGLPYGTTLGELNAARCATLDDDARADIAQLVVRTVQGRMGGLASESTTVFQSAPRAADLQLSARPYNCLVNAGIVRRGALRPTPLGDVIGIPYLGAQSLLEVLCAAESLEPVQSAVSSSAPSAAVAAAIKLLADCAWKDEVTVGDPRLGKDLLRLSRAAHTAGDLETQMQKMGPMASNERLAEAVTGFVGRVDALGELSLTEELTQLVASAVHAQSVPGVVARLGFDGHPPVTLQAAGDLLGITRERIRQLCRQLTKKVDSADRVYAPTLDRALAAARARAPAAATAIEAVLADAGLVNGRFSVESLNAAAASFKREPLPFNPKLRMVSDGSPLPDIPPIRTAARRLVEHWGVTTVDEVVQRLGFTPSEGNIELLRSILELHCDARWLDRERHWFWIRGTRNRLLNAIVKIVSVAGSIEIGDLRDGVGRHHRMKGFRPPRAVLAALCADTGSYRIEGDQVLGGPDLPDWTDTLGANEALLVDVLFEHGPVMRRTDLEEIVVSQRGIPRNSFYIYLTYSPILRRFAPGVYGLRGSAVSAAQVQALVPPRDRSQVLRDHGWRRDGTVWCAYRISKAAEISGVLSPPGALREAIQGRYVLRTEDGETVGTLVVEDRVWGLSSVYRRRGIEAGDYVVLALDLGSQEAVVYVGDEDLLLRFQQGD